MVPDGSMMPFPMPPFDMVWTGCTCTEYIPRRRKVAGRASGRSSCGDGAQKGANGRGARRVRKRLATGWCGGRSIRWLSQRAGVVWPRMCRALRVPEVPAAGWGQGSETKRRSGEGSRGQTRAAQQQSTVRVEAVCTARPVAGQDTAAGREMGCAAGDDARPAGDW
jgi:hypothetical protein